MRDCHLATNKTQTPFVGVVVIGRNEGVNLQKAFFSLEEIQWPNAAVVYVDSGSTDGSVELARRMNVRMHELDPAKPFSAARARNEGVHVLIDTYPGIEFIQFVDGDCELDSRWIKTAVEFLGNNSNVAIVCGRLIEREPGRSVYNWLSSVQWKRPEGLIDSSGGIFMIRISAFIEAGGFNEILITGEEKDLCDNLKKGGARIVRIKDLMAVHDTGILRFGQWWQRAVWGGYGAALQCSRQKDGKANRLMKCMRKYVFWPLMLPLVALGGLVIAIWRPSFGFLSLFCLVAYLLLFLRIAVSRLRMGDAGGPAALYSFFIILRKFATAYGFILFFLQNGMQETACRPDPHTANTVK